MFGYENRAQNINMEQGSMDQEPGIRIKKRYTLTDKRIREKKTKIRKSVTVTTKQIYEWNRER